MFLRFALSIGVAAAIVTLAEPQGSRAQTPALTAPPAAAAKPDAAKPDAAPSAPTPAQSATAEPSDPFGEDTDLTAQPIVYLKGSGDWDNAFETITKAFKTLTAYVDKQGLKADGAVMTIFTAVDDAGFQFEAAIPVAEAPKPPANGDIAVGTSPQGHALKFVHRGSYDSLENTYEAITNYLDEKRLEAKDLYIEQYVTDPLTADADKLVINIFVMIK